MDKITIEYGDYKLEPVKYWVGYRIVKPTSLWREWFPKYKWFVDCEYSSCGPFSTKYEAFRFLAGISKHGQ